MESVLQNLIGDRERESAQSASRNRFRRALRTVFRPLSLALMAVVVYLYHEQLFAAAQPLAERIWNLLP